MFRYTCAGRRCRAAAYVAAGLLAALVAGGAVAGTATVAFADPQPRTWGTFRAMTCDGHLVTVAFVPGGMLTTFHVVGTTDVLVPKRARVVFTPGAGPLALLEMPGLARDRSDLVYCTEVDGRERVAELRAGRT